MFQSICQPLHSCFTRVQAWKKSIFIAPKYHLWIALSIVLICGLVGVRGTYPFTQASANTSIIQGDTVDTTIIVNGLNRTPHFQDTLKWWSGPWVVGKSVSFYRPLTSLIWWGEFQAFGMQGLLAFSTIHVLSHLLVLVIALLFLRELIGIKIATFSVSIFAIHIPLLFFGLPSSIYALGMWKNDPEMWCSAAIILSLWCFLQFLRGKSRRWLIGCGLFFVLGLTIKETAYIIPLLLPLLLWYERKPLSHWRYMIPFYIFAAAAFAFRWWALQGFGFRFGTNGSWMQRWFIYVVGGIPATNLVRGQGLPLAITCCVITALWGFTGKSRWWLIALGVVAAWCVWLTGRGVQYPVYLQLMGSLLPWEYALYTLAFIFLIWRFIANRRRGQIFGWLWIVITYIPLMTAPITQHALYIVALGWSIWMAYAIVDLKNIPRLIRSKLSPQNSQIDASPGDTIVAGL